jgi:hypothetical protein
MSEYQIADRRDSRAFTEFLQKERQFLLPQVSLIETLLRDPKIPETSLPFLQLAKSLSQF